jgi:hypothetical protein
MEADQEVKHWTSTEGVRACVRHGFARGDYFYYDTRYIAIKMVKGDELHIVGPLPPWLESASHIRPLIRFIIHPDILPTDGCRTCSARGHKLRTDV